jgi:hypothetical protein
VKVEIKDRVTFGYSHPLKTMWLKNQLPTVKYGFYGDVLTTDNVSLEHLKPHCKHGKTTFANLVLASKHNNNVRGTLPLNQVIDITTISKYLTQFVNIRLPHFNGNDYVKGIIDTLHKLGVII